MRQKIVRLWGNKFIKGGIIITIASFLTNILNYFFQSLLAHSLGRSNFGDIATLFSYTTISSVPLSVVSTIIIQRISASKNRYEYARHLEEYFFRLLQKWWIVILVAPLLLIPFIPRITNLSPISAYALVPLILINAVTMYHVSALQGFALFFEFSIIGLLAAFIKLGGPILVFLKIDGLTTIIFFIFLSIFFTLFANFVLFRKTVSKYRDTKNIKRIDTKISRFLVSRQFVITLLSLFAIVALNNIDIIFVRKLFNAADTGLYASWSLFAKIIFYVISPLATVSFVFFSGNEHSQNKKAMSFFFMGMACITTIGFLVYQYGGYIFIPTFFGKQFSPVIPYLGLASLFGSFCTIIFFVNNFFLARVSRFALLLPLSIPIYVLAIYNSHRTIQAVFMTDAYFAGGLTVLYVLGYFAYSRREA